MSTNNKTTPNKLQQALSFLYHWAAWIVFDIVAVAGVIHLLGGIDPVIQWVAAIVIVGLLNKETIV